jgi:hypothetical protein
MSLHDSDVQAVARDLEAGQRSLGSHRVTRRAREIMRSSTISSNLEDYSRRLGEAMQNFQVSKGVQLFNGLD